MRQGKETGHTAGKRGGRVALMLLLSVFFMAAGFFVPSILIGRERWALQNNVTRVEVGADIAGGEQVAAFTGGPLTQEVLLALHGFHEDYRYNVFYHEPAEGEMTEAQAVAQVQAELEKMAQLNLIPAWCADVADARYTALLGTRIYEVRNPAVIDAAYDIWELFIYSPELTMNIDLHAASGKIIGFSANMTNNAMARLIEIEESIAVINGMSEEDKEISLEYEGSPEDGTLVLYIMEDGEVTETIPYAEIQPYIEFYEEIELVEMALRYMGDYLQVVPAMRLNGTDRFEENVFLYYEQNLNLECSCFLNEAEVYLIYSLY